MYKRRDAAIAELVANCWDAGAYNVWVVIPNPDNYDQNTSTIIIEDDGCGMDEDEMQDKYLIIGRNRREDENNNTAFGRRVMGRKGIGKLSGFGIASKMNLITWKNGKSIEITLDLALLNNKPKDDTKIDKEILGVIRDYVPITPFGGQQTGTRIILRGMKQASPVQIEPLHESLSRRFSRTVQGRMQINVNAEPLKPFNLTLHKQSRKFEDGELTEILADGKTIKYNYVFTDKPIREGELRGWTIQVNGKTAQNPNFFFGVDADGMSQHSSKYLCGYIEADYLDEGIEDGSDIVSTDRQEIDWERAEAKALWEFGRKLTQKIFLEIAERNGEENINVILSDSELSGRIGRLDLPSQNKVIQFVKSIGTIKVSNEDVSDVDKIKQLGDQVIKAFEYRHFIDLIGDIENASEQGPDDLQTLLSHLSQWEVLESRSILEVIKGRLAVIDKFQGMIVNNAPETANRQINVDNFHDLIAGFPWLLNPEWQVFIEERSISTILRQWGQRDIPELMGSKRIDFLAMQGDDTIAVIEIKSSDDILPIEDIRRLEDYKNALERTASKKMVAVLIYSGKHSIPDGSWKSYTAREDFLIRKWKDIFLKNKEYYEHYRSVLEGHIANPNFRLKEEEVRATKKILDGGSVSRTPEQRKKGLGPQDTSLGKTG